MNAPVEKEIKVLLIDDEVQIRRLLRVFLERNGCQVFEAATGEDGLGETARCNPDVILLDLGLPDLDGLTVLKRLREWTPVPILVVSVRDDEEDKITALNGGADDYVTKPFSAGELLARLRVTQRRVPPSVPMTHFQSGPLQVDLMTRTVRLRGKQVRLTATEYSLLQLFVKHAGRVLTHGHILTQIWGAEGADKIGYLRVYMAYLRDKLEINPAQPKLFITEPGVGYRLVLQD